jgi:hypothetical protein
MMAGSRGVWDRESESGRVLSMVGGDAAVGGFMAGIEWVLTGSRDIPGVYLSHLALVLWGWAEVTCG